MEQNDLSRIIDKIRKLLALSKSPNRAEAAAALNKANELLLQYNLSMKQIKDEDSDPIGMKRVRCAGAGKKWRWLLMSRLAEVNLCQAIITSSGTVFIIAGKDVNIISVEVMWDYLEKAVTRIHLRECPRQAKNHYRESFKLGIATGISEKLEEQFQKNTDPGAVTALVVSLYHNEKRRIDDFLGASGIKITYSKVEIERREAYRKGLVHGRRVNLNKQIDTPASSGSGRIGSY